MKSNPICSFKKPIKLKCQTPLTQFVWFKSFAASSSLIQSQTTSILNKRVNAKQKPFHEEDKRVSNLIKKLRKIKGVKQSVVAGALYMTQGNYSKIESGNRSLQVSQLKVIINLLNDSYNEFQNILGY